VSSTSSKDDEAKVLLSKIRPYPELRDGISSITEIVNNTALISDLFPTELTKNEIKAVAIPYLDFTFNYTDRFLELLNAS